MQRQVQDSATATGAANSGRCRCRPGGQWAESSFSGGMVTSGSLRGENSRWAADVKGKPGSEPGAPQPGHRPPTGIGEGHERPGGKKPNAVPETKLVAHEKALEAAGIAIKLAMRVPAPLKSIADQVIRSASSVPANLAEGHGRTGRDRLHFWRIAYASAKEVDSHLRLLVHAGVINRVTAEKALESFDEVRAMTWRLLNPRIAP